MRVVINIIFIMASLFSLFSDLYASTLSEATTAYNAGQLDEAIKIYQEGASQNNSGEYFYNLSNFYYKKGQLGEALFYSLRAKELLPLDSDTSFNYSFLNEKVIDKIEESRPFYKRPILGNLLSPNGRMIFVGSILLLTSIVLLLALLKRRQQWPLVISLLTLSLFIFALSQLDLMNFSRIGVVTAAESQVYSGIGRENIALFKIHTGAQFSVEDKSQPEWLLISLADGKKGWIKKNEVIFR